MASSATGPSGTTGRSREERVMVWAATLVLVFGLGVTAFAIHRHQRKEAEANRERWLADFSLTDRTGRTITRDELGRRFLVVSFVFTSCSLTCVQVNRRLSEVQDKLAGSDDVRIVSLTVDPRTDTPELLARFADGIGADPRRWYFLTGQPEAVDQLITTSFLNRGESPFPELAGMPGGYAGTEQIAIVDRRGKVRRFVDGLRSGATDKVLETIAALRQEERP